MKQYIEQRIKELNEQYERCQKNYLEANNEVSSKNWYIRLEKIEARISELEMLLEKVN